MDEPCVGHCCRAAFDACATQLGDLPRAQGLEAYREVPPRLILALLHDAIGPLDERQLTGPALAGARVKPWRPRAMSDLAQPDRGRAALDAGAREADVRREEANAGAVEDNHAEPQLMRLE